MSSAQRWTAIALLLAAGTVAHFVLPSGGRLFAHHPDKGHGDHDHSGGGNDPALAEPPALGATACVAGFAGPYPCARVDLASFLPKHTIGGGNANDVWGWTDPLTHREYALHGRTSGLSFVDVTDPAAPRYLGELPKHTVNSTWRSVKVFADHAFIVSEAAGHGMQVFDLLQLRSAAGPPVTFSATAHYSGFATAHTLALDEASGFAYAAGTDTCSGGLHIVDVRLPQSPAFAGCFSADGYTHDVQCVTYNGPDAAYRGREVCFASNTNTLTIVDVTEKSAPVQIARAGYSGRGYTHQGWLTEDHQYFLLDDEVDETKFHTNTRTHIWDVRSLAGAVRTAIYEGPSPATDHNLFINGSRAFEANYRSGLRVLDAADAASGVLREVGFFDIVPADDKPGYHGAWSTYPFFESGTVLVSGIEQGLYVLRPAAGPLSGPDLIASAALGPAIADIGSTVAITATVTNQGTELALASSAALFLSADTLLDAADAQIATAATPQLSPGAASMVSLTGEIPDGTAAGDYYFIVAADRGTAVAEAIENNNTRTRYVTLGADVVGELPDLSVTALGALPAAASPGSKFTITDSVTNGGEAAAAASTLSYYLSPDQSKSPSDLMFTTTRAVVSLAPGATSAGSRTLTVPAAAPDGAHYLLACADDLFKVDESSESNNCTASATTMLIGWADLLTTALSDPPAAVDPGGTFTVTDTAANQGTIASGASITRYYLSLDTSRNAADIVFAAARSVAGLAPGAASTGSKLLKVPAAPPGTYYLLGCADASSKVPERNEVNNCRASSSTVVVR